jgi:hypothetical protein
VYVDGVLLGRDRLLPLLKLNGNCAAVRAIREACAPYRVALRVLKLCCKYTKTCIPVYS